MRYIKNLSPSPALIVALVALMAALGGTAIARTLVTGKDIANDAITSRHVKDGSLTSADLSPRMRAAMNSRASQPTAGPQGPAGPKGPQGPAGPQGPKGQDGWSCKDAAGNVRPECSGQTQTQTQPGGETLLATVTADGKLDHGKDVKAIVHNGSGDYLVSFTASGLDRCTNVATIAGTQSNPTDGTTTISVSPASLTNTIHVQTFVDKDHPTATDKPFNLAVFCQ
jgi:hypothetical protein